MLNKILSQQSCNFRGRVTRLLMTLSVMLLPVFALQAQTGGEAGIQGTVTDSTGAVVPNATVTATDQKSGVVTTRQTTASGLYTISPIIPDVYTVTVKAQGFGDYTQKNLTVDALKMTGLNVTLNIGAAAAEVTVTGAPPALETTNATLGGVLENQTYENLPLVMNNQQRDPTAFATLLPGTQSGSRAPIIGGTGNYLAAVYVDGIPVNTINQQGDNRVVSNAIPVEAIDQFQVVTSTPGAEYEGAGLMNFTLKSGGNGYHGTIAAFFRNRALDTWNWTSKGATYKDINGVTHPAPKPDEHQDELVFSGGGPVPFTRHKAFFYATYDKFHSRQGVNPNILTVPTVKMRSGDFSELLTPCGATTAGCIGIQSNNVPCTVGAKGCAATSGYTGLIFDPTTTAACTAANGGTLCRYAFPGNVIPQNYLSPIAQAMAKALPDPTSSATFNNYLGGVPSGFENHEFTTREDVDLTSKQRLSFVLSTGVRTNVPFTIGGTPAGYVLPLPYTAGGYAKIGPTILDVEHSYAITDRIVNQFKYGFNRFPQPVTSLTDGLSGFRATDVGITNLPAGQASNELPGATFSTTSLFATAETPWTSNGASGATQNTVPNTFTLLDNLSITKGQHNITAGIQMQWLEDNVASQIGPSGVMALTYNANSTANFSGSGISTTTSGFSYASYLLGAVGGTPSVGIQAVSETGGRYHDISPYIQDDWKVTPNLTVNLGLRWDYFPPFHEVLDRWSFLNPTLTNPATGNAGALQLAGNRGAGFSCNCRTPVQTYWKNWGPRIGLAYSVTPKTVLRAGYGLVYSIGGGVGGRAGAGNGTGALGFNVTANAPAEITSTAAAGPSFYLNNSAYFKSIGLANTGFGGPGYTLPTAAAPSAAIETLNTGNFQNGSTYATAGTISYADRYLSGRAPEFNLFNAGIQQAITNDLTLTLNYAGTQSHFLLASGSNPRGYWSNQLNPAYLNALGNISATDSKGNAIPLLNAQATPTNVALLQANLPGFQLPYAGIASTATNVTTISQLLLAFPQYSGVSDTWGNVANISYNSMQVSLAQRPWHGLSYTLNYTWSKNMGDDGTFRSGFDLPAGAVSKSSQAFKMNRIDRSLTTTDIPQNIAAFGVWELPFGKGHIGGNNFLVRTLAGGWQLSSIYTYSTGVPLVVTTSGCTAPKQGQCEPDFNPAYLGTALINGKPGKGLNASNFQTVQYVNVNAFTTADTYSAPGVAAGSQINKIGDVARTAPYGLRQPSRWNADASIRRTFPVREGVNLQFQADCLNVANHPTASGLNGAWSATSKTFGTIGNISGNRDWQLAGRINF